MDDGAVQGLTKLFVLGIALVGLFLTSATHRCFAQEASAQTGDDAELRTVSLDDSARTSYEAGLQAFAAGRFDAALRAFRAGYELSPRPAFLFNMGLCEERRGRPEAAAALYRRFLELEDTPAFRAQAEQKLAAISRRLESSGDATPPASDDTHSLLVPMIVSFAVAGAGAVTFTVAAALAVERRDAIDACTPRCEPSFVDGGRTRAIIADVGLAVALVGLGTGLTMWFLGGTPDAEEPTSLSVEAAALPGRGAVASLQGTF